MKELFRKPSYYYKFNELMQDAMKKTRKVFISHYRKKYSVPKNPPAWMTLELASFGQLLILFKNLRTCDSKKAVAHHFGLHTNVLTSWLETLSYVRNSCTHHSRLWNRKLPKPTLWPEVTDSTWLSSKPRSNRLDRLLDNTVQTVPLWEVKNKSGYLAGLKNTAIWPTNLTLWI